MGPGCEEWADVPAQLIPESPILSGMVGLALALAQGNSPTLWQTYQPSLCHILYIFSQAYWKSMKLYSSRPKKYRLNIMWLASVYWWPFPLCLYTDSYLNDIKGEFSQEDDPSLPLAPKSDKIGFCVAWPFLTLQESWSEKEQSVWGTGSVAPCTADGCLSTWSRTPYRDECVDFKEAALLLIDRLQDVS